VSLIRRTRSIVVLPAALALLTVMPLSAEAQVRRRGPRPAVRSVVVIGGYGYAPYRFYGPRYQWGPYGYPYPPYGFGYAVRDELTSAIRLDVTPKDAQVFVDGYVAGQVDDFDGIFQRLRLRPGNHEITLYLDGYRTVVRNLYANPGSDQKIRLTLERLAPGEVSEAPARPTESDEVDVQPARGRQRPMPPGRGARRPVPADPEAPSEAPARFGTLSLRVQPADAAISVDGERWTTPAGQDRIAIQLAEGRHRVEISQDGYAPYREDILIRRDNLFTLNVSLLRGDAGGR
jgi:hypothetical protein